jgi:hypothetical protein
VPVGLRGAYLNAPPFHVVMRPLLIGILLSFAVSAGARFPAALKGGYCGKPHR